MSGDTTSSDPGAEAAGSTGLFLFVAAVIAFAMCGAGYLSSMGMEFAAGAGVIAAISFVGSMACFKADAKSHSPRIVDSAPLSLQPGVAPTGLRHATSR